MDSTDCAELQFVNKSVFSEALQGQETVFGKIPYTLHYIICYTDSLILPERTYFRQY